MRAPPPVQYEVVKDGNGIRICINSGKGRCNTKSSRMGTVSEYVTLVQYEVVKDGNGIRICNSGAIRSRQGWERYQNM
jgi:hypothetical protein